MTDLVALVAPLSTLDIREWVGVTSASVAGTAVMWAGILAGWWWARR